MRMFTQPFFRAKGHSRRLLLSLLVLCCTGMITHAQTDDTTAAPNIVFNSSTTCSAATASTTVGATLSNIPAPPGIASAQLSDDVWYTFTPDNANVKLTPNGSSNLFAAALYYYNGSTFTYVGEGVQSTSLDLTFAGLTPGTKYYARIWSTSTGTTGFPFTFCATATLPPPSNDDTAGAVSLVFNPDLNTNNLVAGSFVNSTNSSQSQPGIPAPTCSTGGLAHDLWYKFTTTTAKAGVTLANNSTNTSTVVALYHLNGNNLVYDICNAGTGTNFVSYFASLTPNTTYYARVYTTSASATPTFSICVGAVPAPPANDEPLNAIVITSSSTQNCTNAVSGTTIGATASSESIANICGNTGAADDDVWYKFTATSTGEQLNLSGTNSSQNVAIGLYSGSVGSLSQMACGALTSNSSIYYFTGLTVGTQYYIRVYSNNGNATTSLFYTPFSICLGDMPPPPANDELANAVQLTVNPVGVCASVVSGTTFSATQTLIPAPAAIGTTCNPSTGTPAVYATDDDVWYKFNTGTGTNFQLTITNPNQNATLNATIYRASDTSIVTTMCGAANGLNLVGLTANTNYFVRLYTSSNTHLVFTAFNLCLKAAPAAPANDEITGAITVGTSSDLFSCNASYNGTTYSATASTTLPASLTAGANDDVWFKFTPTSNMIYIQFTNVVNSSGSASMYGQIYDSLSTGLSLVGTAVPANTYVSALTPNHNYYLRVFNSNVSVPIVYSTFTLCIGNNPPAPANDACSGAIVLTPNNDYSTNNVVNSSTANSTPSDAFDDPANPSTGLPPSNNGGYANDDVWFKFTANATTSRVSLINIQGYTGGMNMALYSGSCGSLTLTGTVGSSATTSNDYSGLTIGQTYYLRVFTNTSTSNFANFSIFVGKAPASPANDNIANATAITTTAGFGGNTITGTLAGATFEGTPSSTATCGTFLGGDVWYTTTIPANGQLIVQEDAVNAINTDNLMAIYTGTPGSLTQVGCNDGGNPISTLMPRIALTGQTPGATVYIRIGTGSSNLLTQGDFGVEAWDPSPATGMPNVAPGGNCVAATPLTISAATGNVYTWVPVKDATGNIIAELLSNGNNLGVINASVYENTGTIRTANGIKYLDRNITITPTTQPTTPVTVRLYLTGAEFTALQNADPTLTSIGNLNISKVNQACAATVAAADVLLTQTANSTYSASYMYVQYNTPSFSTMFLRAGGSTPLPIELIDFKGYNDGSANNLYWNIGSAGKLNHFELQRSTDGNSYTTIATIPSTSKTAYNYSDRNPAKGLNLYHLQLVDETGDTYNSSIVSINADVKTNWKIQYYPNPAKNQLQYSITGNVDQNASIYIFDLVGKQLKQILVTSNFQTIDLSDLPEGNYIVKYSGNCNSSVSKITKN